MKKLLLLFLFPFLMFAQSGTFPRHEVFGGAGVIAPSNASFSAGIGYGYKFAANYDKPFDEVTLSYGYAPGSHTALAGVKRNMTNDRDRVGLHATLEAGTTTFSGSGVTRATGAAGLALSYDFSEYPYPAWLNSTSLIVGAKLNKTLTVPAFWSLSLGFSHRW